MIFIYNVLLLVYNMLLRKEFIMNRKTKSFLLALYFFLSSSCYGCSKSNDIDIEEVVSTSEVSNEELLNTIGTEPIIETIETLPIEHTVIETEPIVETEPIFETEPVIETEPAITPSKTLDEIALEVIGNKYGYGDSRINGVISQGFDYYEVEKRVYEICELIGIKGLTGLAVAAVFIPAAVLAVTQKGMARIGKRSADLMGPAGEKLHFHKAQFSLALQSIRSFLRGASCGRA